MRKCKEYEFGLETLIKKFCLPHVKDSTTILQIQRLVQDVSLLVQEGMSKKLALNNTYLSQPIISRKLKKIDIIRKRFKGYILKLQI